MGLGAYLRNIKDAALTIADGMAVTASHLVRKPYTVQYPDRLPAGVRVQDTLPFRYRGMLEVDLEICTACLACAASRARRAPSTTRPSSRARTTRSRAWCGSS